MASLKISEVFHRPVLFNNNLLVVGLPKVSLSRAILQEIFKQMGRVMVFLRRGSSHQWKLAHHANATNQAWRVWFKRKGQTLAERFSVVFSHKGQSATTSSGPTSQLSHLVSNNRHRCLLQICLLHHRALAKICLCLCACARRDQIQADGFSNVRNHKARVAIFLHGLTSQ